MWSDRCLALFSRRIYIYILTTDMTDDEKFRAMHWPNVYYYCVCFSCCCSFRLPQLYLCPWIDVSHSGSMCRLACVYILLIPCREHYILYRSLSSLKRQTIIISLSSCRANPETLLRLMFVTPSRSWSCTISTCTILSSPQRALSPPSTCPC